MARNSYACSTDGKTYYLADKNGVQVTKKGWHKFTYSEKYTSTGYKYYDKSTYWVYVKKDGTLQTGLKKIKGTYYYFNPTMRCNSTFTKEGKEYDTKYYFGRDGKCKKTSKIYHSVT
jgi:glucan-binding YG repeat protein